MRINDIKPIQLKINIIKELFNPRNTMTYSLIHPSINIQDYQEIINLATNNDESYDPEKYFIFPFIEGNNIVISFMDKTSNDQKDICLNFETSKVERWE